MTVTTFKKKDAEPTVEAGLVVYLASDENGEFPMTTTGEVRSGRIICRWYDTVGALQGDDFDPKELRLKDAEVEPEEVVDFQADFDAVAE